MTEQESHPGANGADQPQRLPHIISRRAVVGGSATVAAAAALGVERVASAQDVPWSDLTQTFTPPKSLGAAFPEDVAAAADEWPIYQQNYASHRAATKSTINSSNVAQLDVAWTLQKGDFDGFLAPATQPTLLMNGVLYLQDGSSNIWAIKADTGELIWVKMMNQPAGGPAGFAIGYGILFAQTATDLFALKIETGELLWQQQLIIHRGEYLAGTPTIYNSTLYVGKSPGDYGPGYQGGLFAIDPNTGQVMWEFDTTNGLWGVAARNSGGGVWYPASIDENGDIYFGVGNAGPVPGDGGKYRASVKSDAYASSMVALDADTGAVRWYYQDAPHNFFDHDFQLSPILADVEIDGKQRSLAIGGGKTGNVVAVDRSTGEVIWKTPVGEHNDYGDGRTPLPEDGSAVTVLPGAASGGIQTNMAFSDGVVFAAANNCASAFSISSWTLTTSLQDSTGQLAAINAADGSVLWQVELPSMPTGSCTVANDVVFTGTLDGLFRAYHAKTGDLLWSYQFASGIYTPPTIVGDTVYAIASGPFAAPSAKAVAFAAQASATPASVASAPSPEASPAAPSGLSDALVAFRLPA